MLFASENPRVTPRKTKMGVSHVKADHTGARDFKWKTRAWASMYTGSSSERDVNVDGVPCKKAV
jgi:hypothetical protein